MSYKTLHGFAIFAYVYSIYHLTSPPSLPGGDSGELLAAGCSLGTAHPPGYPLYTLTTHFWPSLPFPRLYFNEHTMLTVDYNPSIAWRANNLCSILSAITAMLLYFICDDVLTGPDGISRAALGPAVAALTFAFSPLIWEYAYGAEVFAFNNFLCTLVLFLTARIFSIVMNVNIVADVNAGGQGRKVYVYLFLGAFTSGLALSNQHASLFLIGTLILAVLIVTARQLLSLLYLYTLSFAFMLGLTPYLYLVYASANPQRSSWGDMTTVSGLMKHVLRSEYGTFKLGVRDGKEDVLKRLLLSFEHASRESGHILWPLTMIGFIWVVVVLLTRRIERNITADAKNDALAKTSKSEVINAKKSPLILKIKEPISNSMKSSDGILFNFSFLVVVCTAYVLYEIVWHGVLSNLPLEHAPMSYAVHSRFWMQPMILSSVFISVGITALEQLVLSIISTLAIALVQSRWFFLNRSNAGWTIERYGSALLSVIPKDSMLVAHTDLDLNPVRYLRECEGLRADVTHLSFQLMPFPWFSKTQAKLYPNVSFVPYFQEISTARSSIGNAMLVHRFLDLNLDRFPAIFIDMQSINDAEIGTAGLWNGFTLIPYGALYKVYRAISIEKTASYHKKAIDAMDIFISKLPVVNLDFFKIFPSGSWEHAVASVITDAKYQLGLFMLTYAIELQKGINIENLLIIIDRYYSSAQILSDAVAHAEIPLHVDPLKISLTNYANSYIFIERPKADDIMTGFMAFSGNAKDLYKNCALAWMRLHVIAKLLPQFIEPLKAKLEDKKLKKKLINANILDALDKTKDLKKSLQLAEEFIQKFVTLFPSDKDASIFRDDLTSIKNELSEFKK